jgi:hypothetical protein
MATITLDFLGTQLTGLVATGPWYATYYFDGDYETSTAQAVGNYTATNLHQTGWETVIDNRNLLPIYSADTFLLFKDPPAIEAVATPELNTCLMLTIGLMVLAMISWRKRAASYT